MARIVSKEESKLVLKADGRWFHEGQPATHEGVKRFFHRQIRRDDAGAHYLYNAIDVPEKGITLEEHVYFEVEDTARFVESLRRVGEAFEIELASGEREPLDVASLVQNAEGIVYCRLRDGERARLSRHALTQLEPYLDADAQGIYVRDGARRVPIRSVETPLHSE